jgi:hypothetical protein
MPRPDWGFHVKKWWQSKTMWVATFAALAGIIGIVAPDVNTWIVAKGGPNAVAMLVIGLVNGFLRLVTNKPLSIS